MSVFPFDAAVVDAALNAAGELGLWERAREAIPVEELARGLDARRVGLLVELLTADGAFVRDGDRVRAVAPRAGRPLPRAGLGLAAQVIRSGVPLPLDERAEQLHTHLWRAGESGARALWARLGADGLLLDAGGGAGTYSAAWLEASPLARAHLIDRAPIAKMAREKLARFGERALVDDGEIESVTGAHDAALLCNVLHLHPPSVCARLLERVAGAVRPGGRVIVKDTQIAADRSGPRAALAFALTLAIYGDGDIYTEAQLREWLGQAGVRDVESFTVEDQLVLVGKR
jgi:hypothetical protein